MSDAASEEQWNNQQPWMTGQDQDLQVNDSIFIQGLSASYI